MVILDRSHYECLFNARQVLRNIDSANPTSRHHRQRKMQLKKLKEVQDVLLFIADEPMFDDMQNLDTGGPVTIRKNLSVSLYSKNEDLSDGYQDAG